MENDNDLGNLFANMRYLRKNKALTQQKMAQLLHISVGYVRRLEHGELPPRLGIEFVRYIYRHFGVSPGRLFGTPLDTDTE